MSVQPSNSNEAHVLGTPVQQQSLLEHYNYVKNLPVIAKSIYADSSPVRLLKKATVFSLNGIRHRHELQQVQQLFDCEELQEVLQFFPAILDKPFSPYVCVDWTLADRIEQLQQHFTLLKTLFGDRSALFYSPQGYKLFSFETTENETCTVEMFPGYQCEGSLGMRLIDHQGTEIYTLSLHLSELPERCITIGALQGPNDKIADRQKKIVTLTKSLHGLRPKALMVEVVYMFANALNIHCVRGVSNEGHIYQSSKYSDAKRSAVYFDFDELWQEFQAEAESINFFTLPVTPVRKDIESLKSKKRSLYRKRYAWLEQAQAEAMAALQPLLLQPDFTNVEGNTDKAA